LSTSSGAFPGDLLLAGIGSRRSSRSRATVPEPYRLWSSRKAGSHSRDPASSEIESWCPGRDSNSHALRRRPLKTVCLPVPPPGRGRERASSTAPSGEQAAHRLGGVCAGTVDGEASCLPGADWFPGFAVGAAGPPAWFPGTGTAAPPVAGAGAVWPVGRAGVVVPAPGVVPSFFFAASCAARFRFACITEAVCEDR
jgi:hypothetical protein